MNPNIILAGRQPDFVNVLRQSTAGAQESNQVRSQNALRQLYQQQGPQIMAGEPGAMNALAQHDPMQAQQMNAQRAQMDQQAQAWKMRVSEYARGLKAEEAAAEARQIETGIKRAFVAFQGGDLAGVNAILQQAGEQPIQSLEQFPAVVSRYGDALDALKEVVGFGAGPKPADEYQRYAQEEQAAGRKPLTRIEYAKAKKGAQPSFSVTTPDGTAIEYGVPGGQNELTTNAPRNAKDLSKQLSKDDAALLQSSRDQAQTATQLESLATQLETVAPNVGYTGPGGELVGKVDDLIGVLPGDSGSRGAMRSLSMEAQLSFTEKTKGAITDREMGMFKAAVPNLTQTPEGNAAIAGVMRATAQRVQDRAAFFEDWLRKNGSLEGAQSVWSDYMRENPVIDATSDGGVAARPRAEYRQYLMRKPANSYTPEAIMGLSMEEIGHVPIEKLTKPQIDALERRVQELNQ